MKPTDACLAIARKELGDGLRNRWIWIVSALLGSSALAIAFFGNVPVGVTGMHEGGMAIASLTNFAVYLVPLLALVLGCGAVIEEKQRGTLDLILVYPLSSAEYFVGTFAGFALALSISIATGFGVAGLLLALWGNLDLEAYLLLTSLAVVLGIVFLGLSFLLSLLSRDRGRAVVSSVFVWIGSVLVFDLVLVGILVASNGKVPSGLFTALLLLNPTDVFRILCFKWIHGAASPLGLSDVMTFVPHAALLGGALISWAVAPLFLSYAIFRRRVAADTLV